MVLISDYVTNTARGLAAKRDDAAAATRDVVANEDVLGGTVDAQPIRIAPGLQANVVVVIIDVAVLHQHITGRVDIDAVSAGAFVVGNFHAVDGNVITIDDLHRPEAGTFKTQILNHHV